MCDLAKDTETWFRVLFEHGCILEGGHQVEVLQTRPFSAPALPRTKKT